MDFDTPTKRSSLDFDRDEKPRSPHIGRLKGGAFLLVGMLLFLALFSYVKNEISWPALNSSDVVIQGTKNYLGVVGLYVAGLAYWLLGFAAWVLVLLLYWIGVYLIVKGGKLPNKISYWGAGGVVAACVFLGSQTWFGVDWAKGNELFGVGGSLGYLLGPLTLQKILTKAGVIALAGVVYMVALLYVVGVGPKSFFRGFVKEWKAWRERRARKGEEPFARERKMPKFDDKFGKPKRSAKEASQLAQAREASPAREPRKRRTGDSLDELDPEKQGTLELDYKPKIIDSAQVRAGQNAAAVFPMQGESGYEHYKLPPFEILHREDAPAEQSESEKEELYATQRTIVEALASFGVSVTPGNITRGPTITRYEIYPSAGLKVSKIASLEQDIARATSAVRINILAPIPGRDTVGIEIANKKKIPVALRDLIEDAEFWSPSKKIPVALGKDVYGRTVIGDLAAMPHLLIAGTTGSGKSVCVNSIITSMLYKFRPDELKFILVDPKVVEMQPYGKLPHLIVPVVTDPKKVVGALRWCVNEMERRYRFFAEVGVRNFESFNNRPKEEPAPKPIEEEEIEEEVDNDLIESIAADFESQGENPKSVWDEDEDEADDQEDDIIPDKFPYVVVIIDELADLMQVVKEDIESYIGRLTQKARAAGIHLIVATQTPRSDVVTGIIKANIPCRIAFQVSSALDSRIILDQNGAEKLVGKGDLMYLPPGSAKLDRAQGAFISDHEVEELVAHCAAQAPQEFHAAIQGSIENGGSDSQEDEVDEADEETYQTCLEIVLIERKASTSLLQRRLRIGYGKAARMMDLLEKRGVIGPSDGPNRPREVLM